MSEHIGGFAASTAEALADALVHAAKHERGHCNVETLDRVCVLVLKKLRAVCPCGFGAEVWHQRGVCGEGQRKPEKGDLPSMSAKRRYCEMCDKWLPASQRVCKACGADTTKADDYCAACDREGATAGGDTVPLEFHACQRQKLA